MPDIALTAIASFSAWLFFGLIGLGLENKEPVPPPEPLVVHEVRTATDEEISAAAAEVPELLRRAHEAASAHR